MKKEGREAEGREGWREAGRRDGKRERGRKKGRKGNRKHPPKCRSTAAGFRANAATRAQYLRRHLALLWEPIRDCLSCTFLAASNKAICAAAPPQLLPRRPACLVSRDSAQRGGSVQREALRAGGGQMRDQSRGVHAEDPSGKSWLLDHKPI